MPLKKILLPKGRLAKKCSSPLCKFLTTRMFLQLFLYLVDCGLEKFYKDDENMPIVSFTNLELKDIFTICIGRVSGNLICFILNQEKANIEHILDVDSDDLGLKMTKSENVRFYELSHGKDRFDTSKPRSYSRKK